MTTRTAPDPREPLGKIVRDVWVAAVRELVTAPKPSWVVPWETLTDEFQREVDMRIGETVAAEERERVARLADERATEIMRTGKGCGADAEELWRFAGMIRGKIVSG